jgi:hypothetical protein
MPLSYFPIPKSTPDLSMTITLDQAEFELQIRWNMRGGWFISIADAAGDPITGQAAMVIGTDFFQGVRHDDRVPLGKLMLIDTTLAFVEPGFLDLCSGPTLSDIEGRVMLVYSND